MRLDGQTLVNASQRFGKDCAVAGDIEAVSGSGASLEFREDGTARGTTGCNAFNANDESDGDTLSFGPIAATLAACVDEAVSARESALLAALDATARFAVENDRLRLENSNGDAVAEFDRFDGQSSEPRGPFCR